MPNADEQLSRLNSAHIAEYSALTTRLTYWIYVQYTIYGVAAVALGIVARAFQPHSKPYECWAFLFVVLVIGWAILQTQHEIVSTAIYVERYLRPAVRKLSLPPTDSTSLWCWEQFLNRERGKGTGLIHWERIAGLSPLFGAGFLAALVLLYYRLRDSVPHPFCSQAGVLFVVFNCFWFIVALYLVAIVWKKTRYNLALHKQLDELVQRAASNPNEC